MASTGENPVEAAARAMLRARIEATPWFLVGMSPEERRQAIEREVNAYWHLFISDAAKLLQGGAERGDEAPMGPQPQDSHSFHFE